MSIISAVLRRESELSGAFARLRLETERLCFPLTVEDHAVQSMPDCSPAKWHLAHTSWFFETFLLKPFAPGYREFDPSFAVLFNSYYETLGTFFPRPKRGLLVRPDISTVYRYRDYVTHAMQALLDDPPSGAREEIESRTWLGIHHEQQHEELMLTDIKHLYFENPLRPAYQSPPAPSAAFSNGTEWVAFEGGLFEIGDATRGFAFDNERPRHRVWIDAFSLQSRLVTNREYRAFVENGGYREARWWLSDGWATVRNEHWQHPFYWEKRGEEWREMTLHGMRALPDDDPACHLSYYEADAYARWAGARLPSEFEWERAAVQAEKYPVPFGGRESYHPAAADARAPGLQQLFGEVWQWTSSAYSPYPGYHAPEGALGEYNAKFAVNQQVLRGSSCLTPAGHARATYRNFFPATARWQCTGVRLAR